MYLTKKIVLLACCSLLWMSCKTVSSTGTPAAETIIGSWEGCDGRVVTFSSEENGEIVGRYSKLGGLARYGFEVNETGYKLRRRAAGTYAGTVKWRTTSGSVSWKKVTVSIQGDTYLDDSSDSCAKEMTRV